MRPGAWSWITTSPIALRASKVRRGEKSQTFRSNPWDFHQASDQICQDRSNKKIYCTYLIILSPLLVCLGYIYIYIYRYVYAHTCLCILLRIYYITYNFKYNIDTFHANHSQCLRKLHSEARRRRSKPSIQATACEQHLGVSAETVVVLVMKSGGVYQNNWWFYHAKIWFLDETGWKWMKMVVLLSQMLGT